VFFLLALLTVSRKFIELRLNVNHNCHNLLLTVYQGRNQHIQFLVILIDCHNGVLDPVKAFHVPGPRVQYTLLPFLEQSLKVVQVVQEE
jgi:hypothetical protein